MRARPFAPWRRAAWILALLSPSAAAAAGEGADPFLDVSACGRSPDAMAFLRALEVERTAVAQASAPEAAADVTGADATGASVSARPRLLLCDIAAGRLVLQHDEHSVVLDVADVPAVARPRTAAVAVMETLRYWDQFAVTAAPPPVEHAQNPRTASAVSPAAAPPKGTSETPITPLTPPARRRLWDAALGARGFVVGPARSLVWGAELELGAEVLRDLRMALGGSTLTTAQSSPLGDLSLRAQGAFLSADWVYRRGTNPAEAAQLRLGVAARGYLARGSADSAFGIPEPASSLSFVWAEVHGAWRAPIASDWALVTTLALIKDLRGARLLAGGEEAISLYGLGLSAGLALSRGLPW